METKSKHNGNNYLAGLSGSGPAPVTDRRHLLPLIQKGQKGAHAALDAAEICLNRAILRYGSEQELGYGSIGDGKAGSQLPVIAGLRGEELTTLGDLARFLGRIRHLDMALSCGEAALYAAEIIEAVRRLEDEKDKASSIVSCDSGNPACHQITTSVDFLGNILEDGFVRRRGVGLLEGSVPGLAILMGQASSREALGSIVADLQEKGFLIFLAPGAAVQGVEANIRLGFEFNTIPLENLSGLAYVAGFAMRVALLFGGVAPGDIAPGDSGKLRDYLRRHVRTFVLQFGESDEIMTAAHFSAIFLEFPVLVAGGIPNTAPGIPDWYVFHPDESTLVRTALELLGIRIRKVNNAIQLLPIAVSPAFVGEIIRDEDLMLELGGDRADSFEVVTMVGEGEIEDDNIEIIGPDIDEVSGKDIGSDIDIEEILSNAASAEAPAAFAPAAAFGLWVKVYGRRMQEDFAGVIERRLHDFINYGAGLQHTGQRDRNSCRISRVCLDEGFRLGHLGDLLINRIKEVFPSIVDRVQVTIYTDPGLTAERLMRAREIYARRDEKLAGLIDEKTEFFYSCGICQSLVPNHICIITPERPGICGAISWLEAGVSHELDPSGPHRMIKKDGLLDQKKGIWSSLNEFVRQHTNQTVKTCSLYSLLAGPMTSGRFLECITGIVPEVNGVMVTAREETGLTPSGMDFSTLAGYIGVGRQTPGFMGHSRALVLSRKFIQAEGGLARVVWMPRKLKESLGDGLRQASLLQGLGADFPEKIADEEIGRSAEEILPFLKEQKHPALHMESLL